MAHIIDQKFKDAAPEDTVARIREILSDNGLAVNERWFERTVDHCYSVRVTIDGTTIGTNGKGVTREFAQASAYAELMERLQSGLRCFGPATVYPDRKQLDRQTLKANCDDYLERISRIIRDFDGVDFSADRLMDAAFDFGCGSETVDADPYYSVLEDKTVWLPVKLLLELYGSTGLCAGNSPEEAIIQGFSEIIERWCQRHFMCKQLIPPTIDEDYLRQFPLAYESITDIRSKGFDVVVKDCSMGTGYPVIATILLNKASHAYHVHMGASPVFDIALQRSLTETLQGRMIQSVADTYLSETLQSVQTFNKAFVKGRGVYPLDFFSGKSSFSFQPFPDRRHCSNRELLSYITEFVRQRNMKLYVKDLSYMGFCTYRVVVPDMCERHFHFLTSGIPVCYLKGMAGQVQLDLKNASAEQLMDMQLLNMYRAEHIVYDGKPRCSYLMKLPVSPNYATDHAVCMAMFGYTEWACGNKMRALTCAKQIAAAQAGSISDYFSCLHRVYTLLPERDMEDIYEKLALFYDRSVLDRVCTVVTEGINPFADYVVSCHPEGQTCQSCIYSGECTGQNHRKVTRIINRYVTAFDWEQAAKNLQTLFKAL